MRTDEEIQLSPEDRVRLEKLVSARMTPQKHVWRTEIVLLSADGVGTAQIMRRTGRSKPTVWRWQARFATEGVDGLLRDETRPPGKKPLAASVIRQVVTKTTTEKPPAATHWTARAMAKAVVIAVSFVQKIWQAHGLKPHQVRCSIPSHQTPPGKAYLKVSIKTEQLQPHRASVAWSDSSWFRALSSSAAAGTPRAAA